MSFEKIKLNAIILNNWDNTLPYNKYLDKQPDIIIAYNFPSMSLDKLYRYCVNNNIKFTNFGDLTFTNYDI